MSGSVLYDAIFVDVTQFVREPLRTGVQRVLVKVLRELRCRAVVPFRILDHGNVAILDPVIIDAFLQFFEGASKSAMQRLADRMGPSSAAATREELLVKTIANAPFGVLECGKFFARAARVINLEAFDDPERSQFYSDCPEQFRHKVSHLIHDFLLYEAPELFPQLNWRRARNNVKVLECYAAAGHFYVSTESLAGKVRRYLGRTATEVSLVPFGGDVGYAAAETRPSGYERTRITVMGTLEPRKYPLDAALALASLRRRLPAARLTVIGRWGWLPESEQEEIGRIFAEVGVEHLSSAGDRELEEMLRESAVSIYVSSQEGFGLPVIEFAAQGIPLVTNAAVPAARHIMTAARAVVLDDVSYTAVADAAESLWNAYCGEGREPYYPYTWRDCAEAILATPARFASVGMEAGSVLGGWYATTALIAEARGVERTWEAMKDWVASRLPMLAAGGSTGADGSKKQPAIRPDYVEEVSEVVADNLWRVSWGDLLMTRPYLARLVAAMAAPNHLEAVASGFSAFLGRPIDASAAAESLRLLDEEQRLNRLLDLVKSEEARHSMDARVHFALCSLLPEVVSVMSPVVSSPPNVERLCSVLEVEAPSLDDIYRVDGMLRDGASPLEILLLFALRRRPRGDALDFFLEVAASFVVGRLAIADASEVDERPALPSDLVEASIFEGRPAPSSAGAIDETVMLSLDSALLFGGWSPTEMEEGRPFRWMGLTADVGNPEPERPVKELMLKVSMVYGADQPTLSAEIGTGSGRAACELSVQRPIEGEGWEVRVFPRSSDGRMTSAHIHAEAAASPSVTENKPDTRMLSVCVTEVSFRYAG